MKSQNLNYHKIHKIKDNNINQYKTTTTTITQNQSFTRT